MAKYRIIESAPATITWTHYVEANSEAEALEKVFNGELEDSYSEFTPDDAESTIDEIEEIDSLGD